MVLLLAESSPFDLMPMQEIPISSKPFFEVNPSDFTRSVEGGCIRYRLYYKYGPVDMSIVTIPPKATGMYGNLGLAGEPTRYEVMYFDPRMEEPMEYMTWDDIAGTIRWLFAKHQQELDKFSNPEDDNNGH